MKVFENWNQEDKYKFQKRAQFCGMNLTDEELAHEVHTLSSFYRNRIATEWDVLNKYENIYITQLKVKLCLGMGYDNDLDIQ